MPRPSTTRRRLGWAVWWALLALFIAGGLAEAAAVRIPSRVLAAGLLVWAGLYLLWKGFTVFLWRVGRRLAFSYFLIGVVPIPMVIALLLLTGYLLCGYFVGWLYRDAARELERELTWAAERTLAGYQRERLVPPADEPGVAVALYRRERRVAGAAAAPARWPEGLAAPAPDETGPPRFWSPPDGPPTLVGTAAAGDLTALAYLTGSAEAELSRRSGVWVALHSAEEATADAGVTVRLFRAELVLRPLKSQAQQAERLAFFGLSVPEEEAPWGQRPFLWWGEMAGPLRSLADGSQVLPEVAVTLNATPRVLGQRFFAGSAEANARLWAGMVGVAGLLTSLYGLALLMALFMIFGLSHAVNRLSRATAAVRSGDFSVRIPVRRRDQLGDLQRSFNEMTAHLESAVEAAAQKELLDKELTIARELQRSLLPASLPASDRVDFATLFEPSAAIGGDYFDILEIDSERLAVVIADVAGHGLPTGLRMAMLKAALTILVEEGKPSAEILARLDRIVRGETKSRSFVTATLAVVDFRRRRLEVSNAGHPPTYLLRGGAVEEILLPSSPLGALDNRFGHRELPLAAEDVVVWLSDGLIEAPNPQGEPFGYARVREALAGAAASAADVRDRLVSAIARHAGHTATPDDRTLVAMTYYPSRPPATTTPR